MLSNSLNYLQASEEWLKTVVIGGILTLLSFLIIPGLFVTGYLMRVLRATMRGSDDVPRFTDWGDLGIDGLKAYVIGFVYSLLPTIVIVAALFMGGAAMFSGSDAGAAAGGLVMMGGLFVAAILGLAMMYVLPAALMNYAEKGSIGAGFALGDIRPMLTNSKYVLAFGYAVAIFVGASIVGGLLSIVPVLGSIVAAFPFFYATVMATYVFGHTYAEMYPVETVDEGVVDDQIAA